MIVLALAMIASDPAVCVKLASDYDNASKMLAENFASGARDNNVVIDKARMTLDLMRDNRCKMPTSTPSAQPYLIPAIQCQTYRYKNGPVSDGPCDWSLWKRQ